MPASEVARFTWTSGISRDPVVTFTLVADREGPLTMRWVDNKGAVFEQTATDRVQHHLTRRRAIGTSAIRSCSSAARVRPCGSSRRTSPRSSRATTPSPRPTPTTVYPLRELAPGRVRGGRATRARASRVVPTPGSSCLATASSWSVAREPGAGRRGGAHHPDASSTAADPVVRPLRSPSRHAVRRHRDEARRGAASSRTPNANVLAAEGGPDQMVADWDQVVGLQEMLGFEFANVPDRPVTGSDTLRLGGRRVVVWHPGTAHSAGRPACSGCPDDGHTLQWRRAGRGRRDDGDRRQLGALLAVLDAIDRLHPNVIVPGHGPHRRTNPPGAGRLDPAATSPRSVRPCARRWRPASRCAGPSSRLPPADEIAPGVARQPAAAQCQPGLRRNGA